MSALLSVTGLLGIVVPRTVRLPGFVVPLVAALGLGVWAIVRRSTDAGASTAEASGVSLHRPRLASAATIAGIGAVLVGFGVRALNWPSLLPSGRSVDAAHHGAMVTWIVKHGRLPDRVYPELSGFSEYFHFTHRLVASLASVVGASPMRAMGIAGIALLVLLLASTGVLAAAMSTERTHDHLTAAIAIGATFAAAAAAHQFTLEMITRDNYFLAQLCALTLCMAACVALCVPAGQRVAPVIGAASMACYPLQAPIFPGVVFVLWLLTRHRTYLRMFITTCVLGGVALAVQAPYLGASVDMSQQEGSVTHLRLGAIGGPVVLLLVVLGFAQAIPSIGLFWRAARSEPKAGGAPSHAAAVVVVLGFALATAEHLAFVLGANLGVVSKYSADKIVFQIVPFGLALAGFGAAGLVRRLRSGPLPESLVRPVGAIAFVALLVSTAVLSRGTTVDVSPPMNRYGYELARSLPSGVASTDVGVVGTYLSPYFVWWTGLQRPVTKQTYDVLTGPNPWRAWPNGPTKERYVLAIGRQYVEAFSARTGVTVVRRLGDAALLKRSDP